MTEQKLSTSAAQQELAKRAGQFLQFATSYETITKSTPIYITPGEAHNLDDRYKTEKFDRERHKSVKLWMLKKKADAGKL